VLDIPYLLSIRNVLNVPPQEKSSGERSGLRGGQGISPPLPIQASGNLSFKTSVTKQMKWGGDPSCIKITLLTISCSKVSSCGNTYCSSYSGFKSRPSFSMTLYIKRLNCLKPIELIKAAPTCFGSRKNHHHGTSTSA